jgi:hypothetical protein
MRCGTAQQQQQQGFADAVAGTSRRRGGEDSKNYIKNLVCLRAAFANRKMGVASSDILLGAGARCELLQSAAGPCQGASLVVLSCARLVRGYADTHSCRWTVDVLQMSCTYVDDRK